MIPNKNTHESRILDAGSRIVFRDGLKFFTVEALAEILGMSKKTIYKYFPTKETLVMKIFEFTRDRIRRKFQTIIQSKENPITKFYLIMTYMLETLSKFPIERMAEVKNRYPEIWRDIEAFRLERIQDFYSILKEAQDQHFIKENIDVNLMAVLYMNLINSTFQPEFFIKNDLTTTETLNLFIQLVTEGAFTEEGVKVMKNKYGEINE